MMMKKTMRTTEPCETKVTTDQCVASFHYQTKRESIHAVTTMSKDAYRYLCYRFPRPINQCTTDEEIISGRASHPIEIWNLELVTKCAE